VKQFLHLGKTWRAYGFPLCDPFAGTTDQLVVVNSKGDARAHGAKLLE
jgi:hypothetical protein